MAILLTFFLIYGAGKLRLHASKGIDFKTIRVALLQGNINQYQKWDAEYEAGIRKTYEGLVKKATEQKAELILWPESAVPGWFPNENFYKLWVSRLAKQSKAHHLIGAVSSRGKKDFNSIFHISPEGEIKGVYDKQHLVPFGEYVPLAPLLRKVTPYLGKLGTFESGKKFRLFDINGIKILPNICYEAIFPGLIKKGVALGAHLIVNSTNDGWYLDTGAPEQHFVANIFRAVENGKVVLRVANTGISCVIDPWGRRLLETGLLQKGTFIFDVPLYKESPQTPYPWSGNFFLILVWAGVGFSILRGFKKKIQKIN